MKDILNTINILFSHLEDLGYVSELTDMGDIFYDEPKIYSYSTILKLRNKITPHKKNTKAYMIGGAGVSLLSRELALIKCLSEAIERLSFTSGGEKKFFSSHYPDLSNALNPSLYREDAKLDRTTFKWMEGYSLDGRKKIYIPAQLIYGGSQFKNEPKLTLQISTGAAGGFERDKTLLRGVYEVIERDSLMTIFLNEISIPKIDVTTIKNKEIQSALTQVLRYDLEIHLFNITNDLGVPTYLVFLIDKTGYGPAITVGYKSNLDPEKAILGSIEESLISRVAKRYNVHNKVKITKSPTMSRYLQHLLQQQLLPYIRKSATYREKSKELDHISQLLSRLGFEAYFADITQDSFRDLGHFTYKVIIPKLQPYLPRFYKEYKHDRLRAVAHFFGYTKSPTLSQLPYPFL